MVLQTRAAREKDVGRRRPRSAEEQNGAAAMPVRQPPQDGSEDELHGGVGREDDADSDAAGAEVLAVGRDQGHDNPEPDEVNEDRQEDDQDGGSSHRQGARRGSTLPGLLLNDITRFYGQCRASQVRGGDCLIPWSSLSETGTAGRAFGGVGGRWSFLPLRVPGIGS